MIIDLWENIGNYSNLIPNLPKGIAAVNKLESLEVGRYEFDGGFFMVQKGSTKPMEEGYFEAHRNYIDVQIVVEGSEEVAWEHISKLNEEIPYNEEKDALYLSGDTDCRFSVKAGMCYIAFPDDGHRPVRHVNEPHEFVKIVLKLPI